MNEGLINKSRRTLSEGGLTAILEALNDFAKTFESIDPWAMMSNPAERLMDGNRYLGREDAGKIENEDDLKWARDWSRLRVGQTGCNGYLIGAARNIVNYVVGTGHNYGLAKQPGITNENQAEKDAITKTLKDFQTRNKWGKRQRATMWKLVRDGEAFRIVTQNDTELTVRFLQPDDLKTPASKAGQKNVRMGIEYDGEDSEDIKGYWFDDSETPVDPANVYHLKWGEDFEVPRGCPAFFPAKTQVTRAEVVERNMATVTAIQSSIAMVKRLLKASTNDLERLKNKSAYATTTTRPDGTYQYYASLAGISQPRVEVVGENEQIDLPAMGVNAGGMTVVIRELYRPVAAAVNMPEFMFFMDASNNNLASIMQAGTPAYRFFEALQQMLIDDDRPIIERQLDLAHDGWRERWQLTVEAPEIQTHDPITMTQRNVARKDAGAMSMQTFCKFEDLDYEQNMQEIDEHDKNFGDRRSQRDAELAAKSRPSFGDMPSKAVVK